MAHLVSAGGTLIRPADTPSHGGMRGYVADLLRDCRLSENQVIEEEPEDSPFSARVRATVPETGQLLRWLLGCGANVEVLAPAKWREVVVSQLEKMGAIYGTSAPG